MDGLFGRLSQGLFGGMPDVPAAPTYAQKLASMLRNVPYAIGQGMQGNSYGTAVTVPLHLQNQILRARENQFQAGIRSTPWFSEFVKQYGEEPDLNTKDYDYRKAWAAGIRPERDPYDNNTYHWRSALDGGEMLKSKDHPTAWKEYYMRETGRNPDADGVTKEQWEGNKISSK